MSSQFGRLTERFNGGGLSNAIPYSLEPS